MGRGNAGSWVDEAQGYGNDDFDDYASDGTGYGYQRGNGYGGYPQPEQGQGQYGQQDAYGSQAPYGGSGGYDQPTGFQEPAGYGGSADYGRQQPAGYGLGRGPEGQYGQQDLGAQPEPGYGLSGGRGYQAQNDGYGQADGYPPHPGSGAYPALPDGSDGYQGRDAGNDWYGGQPAAASGASFADTGTYALNGRIIDEYGTGPNETMRSPVRGYPPAPGQPQMPGRTQLPAPAKPVVSGPQAVPRSGPQEQYDDYDSYSGYGRDQYPEHTGPEATGGYPAAVRSPSGGYPAAGRSPSGGYPAAGRNPSGEYPTTVRGTSGEYPAVRNPSGGYPAAQDDYDAYGTDYAYDPAAGYDGAAGGDQRGGYADYPADDDPYQDRYDGGGGKGRGGKGGRPKGKKGAVKKSADRPAGQASPRGKRPVALTTVAVAVVAVVCAAAYFLVLRPHAAAPNPNAGGRLPTAGTSPSDQACVQQYGTYCHIEFRTDDPTPLTLAELFRPVVNYETNGHITSSFTLEADKLDKTCSSAVIGQDLINALAAGKCTQVLRASYVSGDGKIMGTIGVINLATTNKAHAAGKVVGENDFIAPLASKKGVASKLGQGTGVVEAEYKGHYLILTWSEFVNGTTPSTTAQDTQLEQFSGELVAETANIPLSTRMVTGTAPTPTASAS